MAGGHKENTQTQILPSIQKNVRNIYACAQIRISKGNKEIKDLWETGLWIPEAWGVGGGNRTNLPQFPISPVL